MHADERGCGSKHQAVIAIDCDLIIDENTLHEVFSTAFGFPAFYGRNMDAWIDCMSYLDDPNSGMTSVSVAKNEVVVIQLEKAERMRQRCRDLYDAIIECSSFVNWRRLEGGDPAVLSLSFNG